MANPSNPLQPPAAETTIAVVLGASEYPQKPAWSNPVLGASAQGVRDYLRSPTGLALRPAQLLDLFDAAGGPGDQLFQIEEFLKRTGAGAHDLIVYYVGHGCFDHDDYCLGIRATQRDREFISTIESRKLARIIREGFARKRVYVILDSCFAASAAHDWMGDEIEVAVKKMSQPLPRQGTAFLAAASKYDVARAPRGEPYTVFTGAVLAALTGGVDRVQSRLSLYELYEEVRDQLQRRVADEEARPELHVPSQREGDVSRLELFPNAAYQRIVETRRVRAEAAKAEAEAQVAAPIASPSGSHDPARVSASHRRRWRVPWPLYAVIGGAALVGSIAVILVMRSGSSETLADAAGAARESDSIASAAAPASTVTVSPIAVVPIEPGESDAITSPDRGVAAPASASGTGDSGARTDAPARPGRAPAEAAPAVVRSAEPGRPLPPRRAGSASTAPARSDPASKDGEIAHEFAAGHYDDVVELCSAGPVRAEHAPLCFIAACHAGNEAKARKLIGAVPAARRDQLTTNCKQLGVDIRKPDRPAEDCEADPAACQH